MIVCGWVVKVCGPPAKVRAGGWLADGVDLLDAVLLDSKSELTPPCGDAAHLLRDEPSRRLLIWALFAAGSLLSTIVRVVTLAGRPAPPPAAAGGQGFEQVRHAGVTDLDDLPVTYPQVMPAAFHRWCTIGYWRGLWRSQGRLTIAPGVVRCVAVPTFGVFPVIEHRAREIQLTKGLWPLWIGTGLVLVDGRGARHYVGPLAVGLGASWGPDTIQTLSDSGFVLAD